MHEQAIEILSSGICGVGLKRVQIEERRNHGGCHERDIERTEADVKALEQSIRYLRHGTVVAGATQQLCILLDKLMWERSLRGLRCRVCRKRKPEHEDDCEVKAVMQRIYAEENTQ